MLRLSRLAAKIYAVLAILHADIDRQTACHRKSHAQLTSDQMARRVVPRTGQHTSGQEPDVRDRPILQGTEQDMTEQATDRFVCGKIQNVDEVVPTGIEKQGMLVGPEFLGMDAEVMVRTSTLP